MILALTASSLFAATADADDASIEALRAERDAAIAAQDYVKAATFAESLLDQLPSSRQPTAETAKAAFVAGEMLEATGELKTALKRFRAAARMYRKLELGPQEIDALHRVAGVLQKQGWVGKAIDVLHDALHRLKRREQSESPMAGRVELSLAKLYGASVEGRRGLKEWRLQLMEKHALRAANSLHSAGLSGYFEASQALRMSALAAEERGDEEAAMSRYQQAIELLAELAPETVPAAANSGARLAVLQERRRNRQEQAARAVRDNPLWERPLRGIEVEQTVQATTRDGRAIELTVEPGRGIRRPGGKTVSRIDPQVTLEITLAHDYTPAEQQVIVSQPVPTYGRNTGSALATWRFVPTDGTPAEQIAPFSYTVKFEPL